MIERKPGKAAKWPRGEAKPTMYTSGCRIYPCKKCNTTIMKDSSQAVIIEKRGNGFVVMKCRVCGYHFHMDREMYSFDRNAVCNECGSPTIRTSTIDNIQYRKCDTCGHNQKEIGKIVKNSKK